MTFRNCFLYIILMIFVCGCAHPPNLLNGDSPDGYSASGMDREPASEEEPASFPLTTRLANKSDIADCDDLDEATVEEDPPQLPEKNQPEIDEALDHCQIAQEFWEKGEIENALGALDYAYSLILQLDPEDNAALFQQKEDLRFMISKRILEIYASRNVVANGRHNAIPVEINKYVQAEIDSLQKGKSFRNALKLSGRYRPFIVEELKKAGLPEELSWVPLVESGFRVDAFSPARALGLWQFIPSTGYKFGLKRDRYVDERLDPEKSTLAAIAYLKELHRMFGDWTTVLAAYNCGEGRVLQVIRSQKINYLDNFWDLYEHLPRETARYVPRFIATLHIINHPEQYGIDKISLDSPAEYETLTVTKPACLKTLSKAVGIPEKVLCELNPELKQEALPARTYPLRIPVGKGSALLAEIDKVPEYKAPPQAPSENYVYHRVTKGQSLSTIAGRYGVGVDTLMRANNINRKNFVVAGKILKIPVSGDSKFLAKNQKTARKGATIIHTVKRGDSLWDIARKYGTTTQSIRSLNGLSGSRLRIGQELKIATKPGRGKNSLKPYHVRNGDIPFKIAEKHNMSLEKFLKVNKMTRYTKIYPGQTVYVE